MFSLGRKSRLDVTKRFKLSEKSISGTTCKFFLAKEIDSGDIRGLKLVDPDKRRSFTERFKGLSLPSEGEIASSIEHPNVNRVIESGMTTNGEDYLLVEYLDGLTLQRAMEKRPDLVKKRSSTLFPQMAEAIRAVHDAGFIHRDVCPRNFICDRTLKRITLIDFGLSIPNEPKFRNLRNRTGTPRYMAPETLRSRGISTNVDLFSLGITFFEMLSGKHPWNLETNSARGALRFDQVDCQDIREHVPDIEPQLAEAIHRCLETDPQRRFQRIKQFMIKAVIASPSKSQ